jgi:hypothetical protein
MFHDDADEVYYGIATAHRFIEHRIVEQIATERTSVFGDGPAIE